MKCQCSRILRIIVFRVITSHIRLQRIWILMLQDQFYKRITKQRMLEFTKICITWWGIIRWTSSKLETSYDSATEAAEKCFQSEQELLKILLCSRLAKRSSNQVRITSTIASLQWLIQIYHRPKCKWCKILTKTKLPGAFLANLYKAFNLQSDLKYWRVISIVFLISTSPE